MAPFDPDKDIPSLEGKVIFVTGGTAGIGRQTILQLAKHNPSQILFSGRNASTASTLISELKKLSPSVTMTFVQMDLASLASVRDACIPLVPNLPCLDVLICNAGVMVGPPRLSPNGYEIHFATNHLGHAMLIRHLLPVLLQTAATTPTDKGPDTTPVGDVRIIILTSLAWRGHNTTDGISYQRLSSLEHYSSFTGRWFAYGQSKFANLLYAAELARRFPTLLTVSVHPGVVKTELVTGTTFWDRTLIYVPNLLTGTPILSPEEGAHSQIWCAVVGKRDEMVNGGFYMPVGRYRGDTVEKYKKARDPEVAAKLWEWTEEVLDKHK